DVLELAEGRLDPGVGQERPSPVPLQGEQPLGEWFGMVLADEVAAVLPQRLLDRRVGVPAQGAPDDLVDVVVQPSEYVRKPTAWDSYALKIATWSSGRGLIPSRPWVRA